MWEDLWEHLDWMVVSSILLLLMITQECAGFISWNLNVKLLTSSRSLKLGLKIKVNVKCKWSGLIMELNTPRRNLTNFVRMQALSTNLQHLIPLNRMELLRGKIEHLWKWQGVCCMIKGYQRNSRLRLHIHQSFCWIDCQQKLCNKRLHLKHGMAINQGYKI